jgi:hypothetical protein
MTGHSPHDTYGYRKVELYSRDETMMLIQACSVINCANITTAEIHAPATLNKKRQEKGKQPFFLQGFAAIRRTPGGRERWGRRQSRQPAHASTARPLAAARK